MVPSALLYFSIMFLTKSSVASWPSSCGRLVLVFRLLSAPLFIVHYQLAQKSILLNPLITRAQEGNKIGRCLFLRLALPSKVTQQYLRSDET